MGSNGARLARYFLNLPHAEFDCLLASAGRHPAIFRTLPKHLSGTGGVINVRHLPRTLDSANSGLWGPVWVPRSDPSPGPAKTIMRHERQSQGTDAVPKHNLSACSTASTSSLRPSKASSSVVMPHPLRATNSSLAPAIVSFKDLNIANQMGTNSRRQRVHT